jgi:hypothetical protein
MIQELLNNLNKINSDLDKARDKVNRLEEDRESAMSELGRTVRKSDLRPMTVADLKPGQLFFYKAFNTRTRWGVLEIENVLDPEDEFKSFEADGCRLGIADKFVLK